MSIERRNFLKAAAATGGTAALASGFPKPAISQGLREWRMVTSWPKGLPGVGTGAERLADNIGRISDGRLTVKVYAAGELVPALQCFDAVANGTAQLGHDASFYHLDKSEGCAFFTAFPWGFTASELTAWVHHGGGQALWDELYAPFGLKAFLAGNTGAQAFGWFRREIRSVADLQGLKYRSPGNNGKIMTKLGATVILLPAGEIFPALQSGALDAAEWIGPYNDLALGFYQVAPYYYAPGYQEPGAALQLMVNKAEYDALPNDLKAVLQVASQAAYNDMLGEYVAGNGPALRTLVQEKGTQLRLLPDEVLIAMGNVANEILADLLDGNDETTKKIVRSFLAFRADALPATRFGDQAILTGRLLPYRFDGRRG